MSNTVAFDPGLGLLMSDLYSTVYIIENDLQSMPQYQRKTRYYNVAHHKIVKSILNNMAFYNGCLAWAYYICNSEKKAVLSGNPFLALTEEQKSQYAPTDNVDFLIEYLPKFYSDLKYYHINTVDLPDNIDNILNTYRDFVAINEGFISTQKISDIKLPENLSFKTPLKAIKSKILLAVEQKDLSGLLTL